MTSIIEGWMQNVRKFHKEYNAAKSGHMREYWGHFLDAALEEVLARRLEEELKA